MKPTRSTSPPLGLSVLPLLVLAPLGACAPVFSDLQSAKLAGPDRIEATAGYTHSSFSDDGEGEIDQSELGVQVATGVSDNVDMRGRYVAIRSGDETVHALATGPKFGLIQDQFAFYLPVGFAFGSGIEADETIQLQPTMLFTGTPSENLELTATAKGILWKDRDIDDLLGFNLGLGYGPDLADWVIRAEGGMLFNPGEDGHFTQFSLGLTKYFRRGG